MAFNPSGKRQDVSLRLRAQNIKNVRGQTKRLETDNRKMEEQLQELKFAMVKEKEDRERVGGGGGGFWKTGEIGSLSSYGKDALNKHIKSELSSAKSKGSKKKVKVLKNEPIVTPQRKQGPGTMSYIAQRGFEKKESKIKGPKCGQCEEKGAHVTCIECGEDYCAACFAAFHLKGALKKHRSVPIGSDSVRTPRGVHYRSDIENVAPASAASTFRQTSQASRISNRDSPRKPPTSESSLETDRSELLSSRPIDGSSLFDGCYNEAESAAAFKDAVSAWRKGGAEDGQIMINNYTRPYSPVATPTVNVDSSTSANLDMKPIEITFHNQNLTYAERLLLKQHRRTDVSPFPDNDTTTSPPSNPGSRAFYGSRSYREDHRANLSDEERVDFDALYSAISPQPNIDEVRSESRLSIIELDEKQILKTSRILDQSSTYKVVEQADDNIDSPINRIQPDSQIQKHDISTVEAKDTRATKSLTNKRSSRDYDLRYEDISKADQTPKPRIAIHVKSSKVLDKQNSSENVDIERVERPKSAAKTKGQPARPKSRGHTKRGARPPSRASRLAMYGEGHLTKSPSQALKDVARLASQVADIEYTGSLGDFFTCGVTSEDQHPKPATSSHKKKEQPQKWRVSNKLYQMSARSWRPDSSLADTVTDDQAMHHIDSVGIRYCREFLRTPVENEAEPDTMTWSWSASIAAESAEEFVQASKASQKHDRLPSQKSSTKVIKLNAEKRKDPEPMLLNGHSLRSTGSSHHNTVIAAKPSSRSGSSLSNRPESHSGRDSRMIVMDGEDLSMYDHVGMCSEDNEDEEALYQLEWELASQTGMLQEDADGKLSRMSMLDTLGIDPDDREQVEALLTDWRQTSDKNLIEIRDRMRKDEFMEDFEEVEAQILEDEVRALK